MTIRARRLIRSGGDRFAMGAQAEATILVADDSVMARRAAVKAFERLGCLVLEAEDGPGALAQLRAHPEIALLFTDLAMPGMDGADLAAKARALCPGLAVVLTSGGPSAAALPADVVFLRKPWRLAELRMLLQAFTGSSGAPA